MEESLNFDNSRNTSMNKKMQQMRQGEIIEQEIQDLKKIIKNGNSLTEQFPEDNLIRLSIQQANYRKELLLKELNVDADDVYNKVSRS